MQPFEKQTNAPVNPEDCAAQVLDTVLPIMRILRTEMRNRKPADLSVPQFRVLAFLFHHDDASLSDLAEFVGVTLPTMSRAIDGMVSRELVERRTASDDRRRIMLRLTLQGRDLFDTAACAARSRMAERLAVLSTKDRAAVVRAMGILQSAFELPPGK